MTNAQLIYYYIGHSRAWLLATSKESEAACAPCACRVRGENIERFFLAADRHARAAWKSTVLSQMFMLTLV